MRAPFRLVTILRGFFRTLLAVISAPVVLFGLAEPVYSQDTGPIPSVDVGDRSAAFFDIVSISERIKQKIATDPSFNPEGNFAPAGSSPTEIVAAFLAAVFDTTEDQTFLTVTGMNTSQANPALDAVFSAFGAFTPVNHVSFRQEWNGRSVFGTSIAATIRMDETLSAVLGQFVPYLASALQTVDPAIDAVSAVEKASQAIGAAVDRSQLTVQSGPEGEEQVQVISDLSGTLAADIPVRLAYFIVDAATVRVAWELRLRASSDPYTYLVLVDAVDGTILYLQSVTFSDGPPMLAFFREVAPETWVPLTSPMPRNPGPLMPDGIQGSLQAPILLNPVPNAWAPLDFATTTGNVITVFDDMDGNDAPDSGEAIALDEIALEDGVVPAFNYEPEFTLEPDEAPNVNAAAVHVYAVANWWHDRMLLLGFTEADNFQEDNFGEEGLGHDPIHAEINDIGINDAKFTTTPDGECCAKMKLWRFTGASPARDSAFDTEIVIHELSHGLTNRMAGAPDEIGLKQTQGRALGEGYSDFYALALLTDPLDPTDGVYTVGSYSVFHWTEAGPWWDDNYYFGLRHFPYSTQLCLSPFTLADYYEDTYDQSPREEWGCSGAAPVSPVLDGRSENDHDRGEIWAVALWEVRAQITETMLALLPGIPELGNEVTLTLVTESLNYLPADPTYVEARDAILAADDDMFSGMLDCEIWRGFAKRGLGENAQTPAALGIPFVEDFSTPPECP